MLVIAGRIELDPAHREAAIAAAVEMMKETQKEAGCLTYAMTADLEDPGVFRIFEEWDDEQALAAHFDAPHMARFQQAVGGLGVKQMSVHKYEVNSKGPVR